MESRQVTVHLWAAARAAAGTAEVVVQAAGSATVAEVRQQVVEALPERPDLARVLSVCSVLVGDRPVGAEAAAGVVVPAGVDLEFLPPFAGG